MGTTWDREYNNDIVVFDSLTSTFGAVRATSTREPALLPSSCGGLPINCDLPQVNVWNHPRHRSAAGGRGGGTEGEGGSGVGGGGDGRFRGSGSRVFVLGGECDGRLFGGDNYTHYSRLALVGEVSRGFVTGD